MRQIFLFYRTNRTRFTPGHSKTIKRSGQISVFVWAWFAFDGAGNINRINGRLNSKKYIRILILSLFYYPGGLLDFINLKFPMDISFLIHLHSRRSLSI